MDNRQHQGSELGLRGRFLNSVTGFSGRENGNMLVFGLFMFSTMLIASGMAIDFMRHENERTQLQSTLDRAVLAAADIDQQFDPNAVVQDFFVKSGIEGYELQVQSEQGIVHRSVTARAKTNVRTMFLNALGLTNIDAPAQSAANEQVNNVEVSLVLDVSGSMGRSAQSGGQAKIVYLREAAQNFVDTLLRPSTKDRVSVSLVPYTGQTNAGPDLIKYFNLDRTHSYSHCVEFADDDFDSAVIPADQQLEQAQHFGWANFENGPMDNPICSDKEVDEIFAFQNNPNAINARIAAFEPRSQTAIHVAMKWAVQLLDPSAQSIVNGMISESKVDGTFSGRPVAYDDEDTTKIIVLMTDGENVDKYEIPDALYQTQEDIDHFATEPFWNGDVNGNYFNLETTQGARSTIGGRKSADENLAQICSVARDNGVIVFTIGYELGFNATAKDVLANCASSDSHAYEAESIDLDATFSAVARTITQLRLTK